MEKLLTVAVPVYNTRQYLPRCLDSLIVPEFLDRLEVLVVIDGSPDDSADIARQYEVRYPTSFSVVEKENGGHGSAVNVALEMASGKYFRVLDSDDWFDAVNFRAFLEKLGKAEEDIVMTNVIRDYIDTDEHRLWEPKNVRYDYSYSDMAILGKLAPDFFVMSRCSFKTEILRDHGLHLLEKRSFEDTILHIFPISFVNSFIFYDIIVYHYYLGRPGQSVRQKITNKYADDWRAVIEQMASFYLSKEKDIEQNKRDFGLKVLKFYMDTQYITYNSMPYRIARTELRNYHSYLHSLPFFTSIKGKHGRIYSILPYFLFRGLRTIYMWLVQFL